MRRWIHAAAGPPPPRQRRAATFTYGLAQPLLGLQMLRRHPDLLRPVLVPLALVAAFCVLSAAGGPDPSPAGAALRFYAALAGAASAPPFLFANTYSRVAARAHEHLGLGPAVPHRTGFVFRLRQLVRFALVIAVPIAPVLWVVGAVPFTGAVVAFAVSAAWTLHWIVVEALDSAKVAGARGGPPPEWPWFVAWVERPGFARLPAPLRRPAAWMARRVRALTRPWHEEAALVAAHPVLSAGFGLAVAGLLAVPVVNLLVRPAVLVGSVHVLARVRPAGPDAAQAGPTSTSPGTSQPI
jgi:hypothetical protein